MSLLLLSLSVRRHGRRWRSGIAGREDVCVERTGDGVGLGVSSGWGRKGKGGRRVGCGGQTPSARGDWATDGYFFYGGKGCGINRLHAHTAPPGGFE